MTNIFEFLKNLKRYCGVVSKQNVTLSTRLNDNHVNSDQRE